MNEMEKIVKNAPKKMQEMLESVYNYNSYFVKNKEQNEFLEKILFAISIIDRKFFVDYNEYSDNALPIGGGQTISQPSTVVRMLLLAELEEGDSVLEVGAGSGWNASLISFLVYPGHVTSIDRINLLVEKAKGNFKKLRNYLKQNKPHEVEKLKIDFSAQDFFKAKGMYDKIIITAGISDGQEKRIEEMAKKLLKHNGILICPRMNGRMLIFKKAKKLERYETKEEYVFVPLLEGLG